MLKAVAIDDEPPALKIIENFCARTEKVSLQKTFTGTGEALKYLQNFPVDLLFLDINMPSISGIEFYRKLDKDIMVIFTTAHSDYAVKGFELRAVDYLLKPFTYERFLQAVERAQEYNQLKKTSEQEKTLFIRADYALVKISIPDILYIEGLDDYLKIHLAGQKPVVARMTMKGLAEKLPSGDFVRVHRSFIVPVRRIKAIRNKNIYLEDKEIPIGGSYENVLSRLTGH